MGADESGDLFAKPCVSVDESDELDALVFPGANSLRQVVPPCLPYFFGLF